MNEQLADNDVIDPVAFAHYFGRHWTLPTVILALALGIGVVYYALARPVYRAQVTLLYQSIQQQDEGSNITLNSGLALLGLQANKSEPERAKAFGLLRSGAFLLPFIRKMNLESDLFPGRYDSSGRTLLPDRKAPTANELHDEFLKHIMNIDDDSSTGLVTLSIFLPTSQQASTVANQLVEELNDALRDDAVSQAQTNIAYLDRQLISTQVSELRSAIAQLVQNEMRRLLLASGRNTRAFAIIDPAIAPDLPYAPRKLLVAAVSLLSGFMLGLIANLLRFLKVSPRVS